MPSNVPNLIRYRKRRWQHYIARETAGVASLVNMSEQQIQVVLHGNASNYVTWNEPKPGGGERLIHAPKPIVRRLQERLLQVIYRGYRRPAFLHGWMPGRSTVTFAKKHVGKQLVITLDIADYFPSVPHESVREIFQVLGFSSRVVEELATACSCGEGLPQGAPTSPILANLAGLCIDMPLRRMARARGLNYGRYGDDIALSGDSDFRELLGPIREIIRTAGFQVAEHKTKIMGRNQRQSVCGLVVNDRLRPSKEYVALTNEIVRHCLAGQFELASRALERSLDQLKSSVTGRVSFIKSVDRSAGESLRKKLYGVDWEMWRRSLSPCE